MPLRDHFRSPVNDKHSWDEVHGFWPASIVREMYDLLPAGFQGTPKIHLGSPAEVDVATYDNDSRESDSFSPHDNDGGVATLPAIAPTLTVEADLSEQDQYEVLVYDVDRGRRLVAAIEIVSPSNKDRPESRETFVRKVAGLLQQDVCVSIVDLISIRQANLYAELLTLLGRMDPNLSLPAPHLYAVTLRSRKRPKRKTLLDAWFYPMTVGRALPTLPLWLTPDLRVMLPLETSYEETCKFLRIA